MWTYSPDTTFPMFKISKTVVKKDMQYFIGIGDGFPELEDLDFVQVEATRNKEDVNSNYVPRIVNMTINYYQSDEYTKQISRININFAKLESWDPKHNQPINKDYSF